MSPTPARVWRILTSHCKEITHSWRTWRLRKMRNQKTRSLNIEQTTEIANKHSKNAMLISKNTCSLTKTQKTSLHIKVYGTFYLWFEF